MADSVIDHLFDEAISSDLPMPGAELDFFLDHLPVDDTSTFDVVSSKCENIIRESVQITDVFHLQLKL